MRQIFLSLIFFTTAVYSYCQTKPNGKDSTNNKPKAGIAIDRATVDFNLNSGQTGTTKITVTNTTKSKVQMNVYLNDWLRDTVGAHTYLNPGTISHSCSKWISLDKTFLEINPGQSMDVNIKMQVPDSLSATKEMKWSMLFIETVHEKPAPGTKGITTGVTIDMRYGIHIYQTPPNLSNKDLKMLSFGALPNSKNKYRMVCQNTGEMQLECQSYLELLSMSDGKKTKVATRNFPLFPEQKRYVDFTLPDTLPKGKYTVTAVLDGGSDIPLEAAQVTIEIN
jgi:hypothetical protein